jgi:hypothetical protein
MRSFHFSKYNPNESTKSSFEKLFDIFTQLLTHTSGDYNEVEMVRLCFPIIRELVLKMNK